MYTAHRCQHHIHDLSHLSCKGISLALQKIPPEQEARFVYLYTGQNQQSSTLPRQSWHVTQLCVSINKNFFYWIIRITPKIDIIYPRTESSLSWKWFSLTLLCFWSLTLSWTSDMFSLYLQLSTFQNFSTKAFLNTEMINAQEFLKRKNNSDILTITPNDKELKEVIIGKRLF